MELTPFHKDVIHAKVCPYCKSSTKIISETEVYGREYKGNEIKPMTSICYQEDIELLKEYLKL